MYYCLDGDAMRAARHKMKMTQDALVYKLRILQIGFGFSQGQISKMEKRGAAGWLVTEWQAMCIGVALQIQVSELAVPYDAAACA